MSLFVTFFALLRRFVVLILAYYVPVQE